MRELKFRVWDNEKKCWIKDIYNNAAIFRIDPYEPTRLIISSFCEGQGFSIQQYTGMKDRNGNEIYEGDILEWGMSHDTINPFPRLKFVEFHMPQLIYKAVDVGDLPSSVEYLYEAGPNSTRWCRIVGNIFQDPELLNNV